MANKFLTSSALGAGAITSIEGLDAGDIDILGTGGIAVTANALSNSITVDGSAISGGGVIGSDGQTLRYVGSTLTANSFLYNTGAAVSVGHTAPDGNALLDLNAPTGKVVLLPKIASASLPATGLQAGYLAFDTDVDRPVVSQSGTSGIEFRELVTDADLPAIDHTTIQNVGVNTHAQIDTHITAAAAHLADTTVHFTEAAIDHANILNVGTTSHADIDAHVASQVVHLTAAKNDKLAVLTLTGDPSQPVLVDTQAPDTITSVATNQADGIVFACSTGTNTLYAYTFADGDPKTLQLVDQWTSPTGTGAEVRVIEEFLYFVVNNDNVYRFPANSAAVSGGPSYTIPSYGNTAFTDVAVSFTSGPTKYGVVVGGGPGTFLYTIDVVTNAWTYTGKYYNTGDSHNQALFHPLLLGTFYIIGGANIYLMKTATMDGTGTAGSVIYGFSGTGASCTFNTAGTVLYVALQGSGVSRYTLGGTLGDLQTATNYNTVGTAYSSVVYQPSGILYVADGGNGIVILTESLSLVDTIPLSGSARELAFTADYGVAYVAAQAAGIHVLSLAPRLSTANLDLTDASGALTINGVPIETVIDTQLASYVAAGGIELADLADTEATGFNPPPLGDLNTIGWSTVNSKWGPTSDLKGLAVYTDSLTTATAGDVNVLSDLDLGGARNLWSAATVDAAKVTTPLIRAATVGGTTSFLDVVSLDSTITSSNAALQVQKPISLGTTNRITDLADPVAAQDAATKAYVDASTVGLDLSTLDSKTECSYATTSGSELKAFVSAGEGVGKTLTHPSFIATDGQSSMTAGTRILIKDAQVAAFGLQFQTGTTVGGAFELSNPLEFVVFWLQLDGTTPAVPPTLGQDRSVMVSVSTGHSATDLVAAVVAAVDADTGGFYVTATSSLFIEVGSRYLDDSTVGCVIGSYDFDWLVLTSPSYVNVSTGAGAQHNGIYEVTQDNPRIYTRATDADGNPAGEVSGANTVYILNGTTNAGRMYYLRGSGALTPDTDAQYWVVFNTNVTSLANLTDVSLETPAIGHTLRYDGSAWSNGSFFFYGTHTTAAIGADPPNYEAKAISPIRGIVSGLTLGGSYFHLTAVGAYLLQRTVALEYIAGSGTSTLVVGVRTSTTYPIASTTAPDESVFVPLLGTAAGNPSRVTIGAALVLVVTSSGLYVEPFVFQKQAGESAQTNTSYFTLTRL